MQGITIYFSSRSIYQYGVYIAKVGTPLVFSFYLLKIIYHHEHLGQDKNTTAEDISGFVFYSRFVA